MTPARLNELLRATSRSFYLTLRVLPRAIRSPIGLAYLLARTTDTVADTELLPVSRRLEVLGQLRARLGGADQPALDFGGIAEHQAARGERELLLQAELSLAALRDLSASDRQLVQQVLATICSGQELDLQRFGGAGDRQVIALQTEAELDDYTYRVAGCVGEFWTQLCLAHLPDLIRTSDPATVRQFRENGVRFGQGLQLVNILRDLAADLAQGRCYLPAEALAAQGLQPGDLMNSATEAPFRPLYHRYLDQATAHLAAGWDYTDCIQWKHIRLRLACAWPVLIGLETLHRLRTAPVLDANHRVKISRATVRNIMFRTLLCYPFRARWRQLARWPS
jgi:farnesyl-diphosphate farnesyltransferase